MKQQGTSETGPLVLLYMKFIIKKTEKLNGVCTIPSSKSETIRALVFAALGSGQSEIRKFLDCEDTRTTIQVLKNLGVQTTQKDELILIKSMGLPMKIKNTHINTGNSGITTRFILPVLGLRDDTELPLVFDCGNQMRRRPIQPLVNALNKLGMKITFIKKRGECPLLVKGALRGGTVSVNGLTSQYLSALLMSLPLAPKDSVITVKNLHERPYVEMTLEFLKNLGVSLSHQKIKNMDIYKIEGRQKYRGFHRSISGDFSSASCLIVAGCLVSGKVVLKNLDIKSAQGDKRLITILRKMGADIKIAENKIIIHGGRKLIGIAIDANDVPDLVPALAVVATCAHGKTRIYNVTQARLKETDRIKSMTLGLRRLGARVEEFKDGLTTYQSELHGRTVRGFDDHRTVMALTVAGMVARGTTIVTNAEVVNKTFPKFYRLMRSLGGNISLKK